MAKSFDGIVDRVVAGIHALVQAANQHVANELASLEQMLAQRESNEPELRATVRDLSAAKL